MVCAVGFITTMALPKDKWPGARYGMLFVIASGLYPPLCGVIAWNANNLAGSWKRAIGVALQITIGNQGGAVGSNIYLKPQAPYYWTGYSVSLVVLVMAIFAGYALRFGLERVNRKREAMTEEETRAMYTPEQLQDMSDKSPLYRYTL